MMKKWIILLVLLFIPSVCGAEVNFNQDADRIDIADFDIRNGFTCAGWINCDTVTDDNALAGNTLEFQIWMDNATTDHFVVAVYNGGWKVRYGTTVPAAGTWYHLALVDNDTVTKLYVNGVQEGADITDTINNDDYRNVVIGCSDTGGSKPHDGPLTEVAMWSTALTTAEVSLLYTSRLKGMPLQIQSGSLLGYWPLNDLEHGHAGINGDTFRDRSGNGNDGTGVDADGDSFGRGEHVLSYPPGILGGL